MAINLRSRMDPEQTLLVCDVSEQAIKRFQEQTKGKGVVRVVDNGYEAAVGAVSPARA